MTKPNHCPANERIKRRYFMRLKEAKGYATATIDGVAAALARYEEFSGYRDFKKFHLEQVRAFKSHLTERTKAIRSGQALSAATIASTLRALKAFFEWLADQPGYRAKIRYSDAEYFTPPAQGDRIAAGRIERPGPELNDVHKAIAAMPASTALQQRDRALVALILLTATRDSAAISLKLKHLDLANDSLVQDAREVKTKHRKTIVTTFLPVGGNALEIVAAWKATLAVEFGFGPDDPLFPATAIGFDENSQFAANGFARKPWASAAPVREIFKQAFRQTGQPYHNPHSLRKTAARLGGKVCRTPEEVKAWSQNIGHNDVLTTFMAYGNVAPSRQAEIIKGLSEKALPDDLARDLAEFLKNRKLV